MEQWRGTLEGLEMNPAFWRGRRVFLTGHTGFKGAWLSLWLTQMGAQVTGYALEPPTDPSLFDLAKLHTRMDHIVADVRDLQSLKDALRNSKAEIVIHMAAQALVQPSYREPVETFDINVMGTVDLLEAVRSQDTVRVALIVTSDKCSRTTIERAATARLTVSAVTIPTATAKPVPNRSLRAIETLSSHPRATRNTGLLSPPRGRAM